MRRGRFAPTPSGQLHIGNARTALLAWLQIRHCGGQFVLRIEDIDTPRCKPALAEQTLEDLRWLGMDWDEGPDIGGGCGPYSQSDRTHLYESAWEQLRREGFVYPCFCSRARRLAIASAPHGDPSESSGFCECAALSPVEIRRRMMEKAPSYRFRMAEKAISFRDGVAGEQHFGQGCFEDFIIKRADGIYAYQLAVVVDDAMMEMTDVLRGWDLLHSTPRQIQLYEALGHTPPAFAHVPLLCDVDGRRLSKRSGSIAVSALRKAGVSPERLVGTLAYFSGLTDRIESITAKELIPLFNPHKIPIRPVIVQEEMLQSLTCGA